MAASARSAAAPARSNWRSLLANLAAAEAASLRLDLSKWNSALGMNLWSN